MLGQLNPDEIEDLLQAEVLGRIGCSANGLVYVVPVTYTYDGNYVYAYSKPGMKIQMMRQNPMVCFEVDKMESLTSWKSVIAWGKYEELKNNDQKLGLHKIIQRFKPLMTSETSMPHNAEDIQYQSHTDNYKTIIYRIKLLDKSGRFERQ